ncbi:gp53-like domain-containing protein [Parafrankia sp. FMc2]|uniref:gp53-like domain-containing protein n=1 Tax=Parafrankia sp. FMc2 TaxID=3233196 RepID=UPI0034D614B3
MTGTFSGSVADLAVSVTFPSAFPTAPAAVFVSGPLLDLVAPTFAVEAPTGTGFDFVVQRRDGAIVTAGVRTFYWLAVA